ncbi:MAG TPA: ATP-binding protein [Vicinamibacteria bacterium]|nr:ATP-binding protein [Vicinamibacteria bacterium]
MKRSDLPFSLLFTAGTFWLVVHDVRSDFQLLDATAAWAALSLTVLFAALLPRSLPYRRAQRWLIVGALLALALRCIGYEWLGERSVRDWESFRERDGLRTASGLQRRFTALCGSARSTARQLARTPAFAMAVEGSDAEDYRSEVFGELATTVLPRAHPAGAPGASLYDVALRPLAWSGHNVSLDSELFDDFVPLEATSRILEQGVETYLVVIEPLRSRLGFVSIEIPLRADRRLENRYLADFDALGTWAGRSVEANFVTSEEERIRLERDFETRGDVFWSDVAGNSRVSAALRCEDGSLMAWSRVPAPMPTTVRLDTRHKFALAASIALLAAAVAASIAIGLERPHFGVILAALWFVRLVLLRLNIPLGLSLDLDNPAHYASSLLFGLARSPADFLLTASVLAASCFILPKRWRWERAASKRATIGGSAIALIVLASVNFVVRDASLNSSLGLSAISFLPMDAPRLAIQVALLLLFVSGLLIAGLALSLWESEDGGRNDFLRALTLDALLVAIAYLLAARLGWGGVVLASALPLVTAHLLALRRAALLSRLRAAGPGVLVTPLALPLAAAATFYPGLARFEDRTVRNFVETTVEPAVRQHEGSRLDVVAETAHTIDQMEDEGRLEPLSREDSAYRLWVGTDLASSATSSAVEILDPDGRIVSRFALNFPWLGSDEELPEAPSEWIYEKRGLPGEPQHPGFHLARRTLTGPRSSWEIRFGVAFDWRDLPFVVTSNPYLHLFRTPGETPLRFPYQELELFVLQSDGSSVFQSSDSTIRLTEEQVRAARQAPIWVRYLEADGIHQTYLFTDSIYLYALSYPAKPALTYAAELAGWSLLAAGLGLVAIAVLFWSRGGSRRELWERFPGSFYGRLYVAFVLIALVSIVSLAFLIRGIVVRQLERDVEQDATVRAHVVERLVAELDPDERENRASHGVTDSLLERVGTLASVDVDVYWRGELVATSKPELFASGLLRSRTHPSAYREIVLDRLSHSFYVQALGSFEYLVVSVPITLERYHEPGILSLPLASRQPEIDRRVSSLNQTVLLAALGFSIGAAWLAHSLARRIAGPINALTAATRRVAEGELDIELDTGTTDEIGVLSRSFTQMTADLKQQRQDLERTKKLEAWAEMARQIAHDIKNPLTPIQLSTEHLLRVYRDGDVDFERVLEDCSSTILDQVKTLRQISSEFSTFASPEPLTLERTDMAALARETLAPYLKAPPGKVDIQCRCAEEVSGVLADRRLFKRTLVNLIENALHAIDGCGRIELSVAGSGDGVAITVSDTGVGIDPDVMDRVFEPYFSTRAAGTGLGLAIAKKVVEDHGGSIRLESERGKGTRVTIWLPEATTKNHSH